MSALCHDVFLLCSPTLSSFFFTATAPTQSYTLSLHDALPISHRCAPNSASTTRSGCATCTGSSRCCRAIGGFRSSAAYPQSDRKSTRLNSSHQIISYAVFCLKKKKTQTNQLQQAPIKGDDLPY